MCASEARYPALFNEDLARARHNYVMQERNLMKKSRNFSGSAG
jgi:hypothetical protein